MYDLHVPEQLYEKEIKKLKEAPAKLIENKDLNSARRKKEADRLNTLMERLQVEFKIFYLSVHKIDQVKQLFVVLKLQLWNHFSNLLLLVSSENILETTVVTAHVYHKLLVSQLPPVSPGAARHCTIVLEHLPEQV